MTSKAPPAPVMSVQVPRRAARWTAVLVACGLSCVMTLAAGGYQRPPPPQAAPMAGVTVGDGQLKLAPGSSPWKHVRVGVAQESASHRTAPIPARVAVDERRATRVGSPLDGRVVRVHVQLGQAVREGEPLLELVAPGAAEQANDGERARLALDAARANAERVTALVGDRLAPERDAVEAQRAVREAELAVQLAQRKRALLKNADAEGRVVVRARRAGVVVEKNVLEGQEVRGGSGETLMVLADLGQVWVLVDVFGEEAQGVKAGMDAEVVTMSAPGQTIRGVVDSVSAVVDPVRHSIPVRVRVDNRDGALRPNDQARVRLLAAASPGSVEVAASAAVSDGERSYVYVEQEPGRFVRRLVVAGPVHDGTLTVLRGLGAGERVVEDGALLLDNQIQLETE